MASIGDVFLRIGLEGTQLEVDAKRQGKKAGDAAGAQMVVGIRAHLSDVFKAGIFAGGGAAIAAKGINALTGATQEIIGTIADMTEKAIADEESVNRLGASLKANVPGWNGNTDAIERNIKAAQRLGFSDETLRDSLTVLLGATHDVAKAHEIQAIAMDLARFKGIDLRTASEALIKVEGGVYRSLKSLGIVLRDGATQTEALAAVQAVASGQAEAYANTTRGKLTAATIELDEAMEHLGKAGIPVVVEAARNLTFVLDRTSVPLELLQQAAAKGSQGAIAQFEQLKHVAQELGVTIEQAWQLANDAGTMSVDVLRANIADASSSMIGMGDDYRASGIVIGQALAGIGSQATDMSAEIAAATVTGAQSVENMKARIIKAAMGIIDGAYGVLTAGDQLSATNAEISAKRREIAQGSATGSTDRQTAALDRKSKALDKEMDAERRSADAQLAAVDAQEKALNLAEHQLDVDARRRDLNEQLNAAQLTLTVAQGGTDAGAISDAMAEVADLQAQQVENERSLGVDAQRDRLQAQRDEIQAKSKARQDELTALKTALADQRAAIRSSGAAVVSDAKRDLAGLYQTQADLVLTLAGAGHAGSKEVADALVDMHNRLATAAGEEKTAILATIKALEDLQGQAERTFVTLPGGLTVARPVGAPGGPQVRDRGGPVTRGMPYLVGEHRPEVFVPGERGAIVPSVAQAMGRWTAGGDLTVEVPVILDGEVLTRVVSRRLANELNR